MRESFWGYAVVVLGITSIVIIWFMANQIRTDQHDYNLLKETTEQAMIDAVDLSSYRNDGTVCIIEEKFVENFIRRFADNADLSNTYKIEIYDVTTCPEPPKVSIKVSTAQNTQKSQYDFDLVNNIDAVLETKYTTAGNNEKNDALDNTNDETTTTFKNGDMIYFNVNTGQKCDDYTPSQSIAGVKSGCMKFYAFNDMGDRVNLLLDHNTTNKVMWNSSRSNNAGPSEVINQLVSDTKDWSDTLVYQSPYVMDQTSETSLASYTITYTTKARLIDAKEYSIYFDDFLDFSYSDCSVSSACGSFHTTSYGNRNLFTALDSFWTSSSSASSSSDAWCYSYSSDGSQSYLRQCSVSRKNGVRPVITVLKTYLE